MLQMMESQFPSTEYDRKLKVVQFEKQNKAIEIKIKNDTHAMETSGWIAEVTKGKPVSIHKIQFQ